MSELPEETIARIRAWAGRPPRVGPDEALRSFPEVGQASSGAESSSRAVWLLGGLAAAILIGAVVWPLRQMERPAVRSAPAAPTAPAIRPAAANRMVVVELSSGTRVYVTLHGS